MLLKSRAARDASLVFFGQVTSVAIQTGYFVLLARLLGSREYGVYAGAFALVSIMSQYAALGSGTIFLRYVSPDHNKFSAYWGNILASVAVTGLLIVIGLKIWGKWAVGPASAPLLVTVAIGDCFFRRLTECASQVFQAMQQFRYTAMISMLTNLFRCAAAAALFLFLRHTNAGVWAVSAAAFSGAAALVAVLLITQNIGSPSFSRKVFTRHAFEGAGFSVASATGAVYNDIDKLLLSHFGMTVANGIYTLSYRVADICTVPIGSMHSAMLPRFFKRGNEEGIVGTITLARRLLQRTSVIGVLAAFGMFFGAPLLPFILGQSFSPSVGAVRWLCLLPLFRSLHLSAGDALLAGGYQKVRFAMQATVAIANFVANLYLIPRYSWHGAAWATLGTDGSLGIISWIVLVKMPQFQARFPRSKQSPEEVVIH
jgi:O-antigen/teichoic acid export membrane protein